MALEWEIPLPCQGKAPNAAPATKTRFAGTAKTYKRNGMSENGKHKRFDGFSF